MSVLILTSCVAPNTQIKVYNFVDRGAETLQNINALIASGTTSKFSRIIIADCSEDESAPRELFKKITEIDIQKLIEFQHVGFSEVEKKNALQLGKGYSELLMLQKIIKTNNLEGEQVIKVSGRYMPRSWPDLVKNFSDACDQKAAHITFSRIRKTVITYAYSIKANILLKIAQESLFEIDDRNGSYIEHIFYAHLVKRAQYNVKRVNLVKCFSNVVSGSTGKSASFIKASLRTILYSI